MLNDVGFSAPESEYVSELLECGRVVGQEDSIVGIKRAAREFAARSIELADEVVDVDVEEDR